MDSLLPSTECAGPIFGRRASDAAKMQAKQRALAWMLIWSALFGLATGSAGAWDLFGPLPQIVAVLAFITLTYRWCDADAQLRRFGHWETFVPALYICPGPLVTVPAYLVATRRARCLRSLSLAATFLFVMVSVAVLMSGLGRLIA